MSPGSPCFRETCGIDRGGGAVISRRAAAAAGRCRSALPPCSGDSLRCGLGRARPPARMLDCVQEIACRMEGPMTDEHPMMAGSATVFVVSDITASLAYYRDVLGFEVTFEYGQPPSYACLCRDEVGLHLLAAAVTKRLPGHGGICIFVRDVDQIYAELSGRGAEAAQPAGGPRLSYARFRRRRRRRQSAHVRYGNGRRGLTSPAARVRRCIRSGPPGSG